MDGWMDRAADSRQTDRQTGRQAGRQTASSTQLLSPSHHSTFSPIDCPSLVMSFVSSLYRSFFI